MIEERARFDRAIELFDMPEPAYGRLRDRRDRRTRRQRVTAMAIAVAVVAATTIFIGSAFDGRDPDRELGGTGGDVRVHAGLGVSYVLPGGWTSEASAPDELVLDAGRNRSVIVSRDVWVGPPGCRAPGTPGRPRCRTADEGIFAWLRSRGSLEADTGIRPIGIDGFDTFRIGLRPAPGVTTAQVVLHRTGEDGRPVPALTLRPGTRILLHLVVTDRRGLFAVALVAPDGHFDAFAEVVEPVLQSLGFRP